MKPQIHELAEALEGKRLVSLKLNLSGFFLAGIVWLYNTYWLHSEHMAIYILLGLGGLIWFGSLLNLARIRSKINGDDQLKQFFNDELSAYNRLKTWKIGFIALLITLIAMLVVSFLVDLEARFVIDLSLFVAISTVLMASIVLEERLSVVVFQEEFDTDQYDVWNWKHWAFFHFILNPGIAFNELVLGQRSPKVMLIDKKSDKPLMERNYVPCPHCNTVHDARTWSSLNKTAFGNWYGFYCNHCGEIIPCVRNMFSYIILIITYPIRLPFLAGSKRRWEAKQPARYENISFADIEYEKISWWKMGLKFGAIMFVFMTFIMAGTMSNMGDEPKSYWEFVLDPRYLVINLVSWTVGGLVFGWVMKYFMGPKSPWGRRKTKKTA